MTSALKEIRAVYNGTTIRVYQAYSHAIAESALATGTFVCPPFKLDRMTWIKPSFLWMMYRSGWGSKDSGQTRILAIDITREGFEWSLANSVLSRQAKEFPDKDAWIKLKKSTPVRIQWDPERDLNLNPLAHRTIQIGLSNEAVKLYVNDWVQSINEVTELGAEVRALVDKGRLTEAQQLCPTERVYPLSDNLKMRIEAS